MLDREEFQILPCSKFGENSNFFEYWDSRLGSSKAFDKPFSGGISGEVCQTHNAGFEVESQTSEDVAQLVKLIFRRDKLGIERAITKRIVLVVCVGVYFVIFVLFL